MNHFRLRLFLSALLLCGLTVFSIACKRSASAPAASSQNSAAVKRYHFQGKIVSVDAQAGTAEVDGDEIPGFMGAMTMSYEIRPRSDLQKLHAGDVITADVVVDNSGEVEKYWLENVAAAPAAAQKP
jgi:protein SCO1